MSTTFGFSGRPRASAALPPGQYLTEDFPVLSAGPIPRVPLQRWHLSLAIESVIIGGWTWPQLMELPTADITVDLHCVTRWSKLATRWRGVSLDDLVSDQDDLPAYATARSYGGYTTNVPTEDLLDGRAWIATSYEGEALTPEHGGPARLLVPHLYLWKSAKWIQQIVFTDVDTPGFWETAGYHEYGDPWREQRYWGD